MEDIVENSVCCFGCLCTENEILQHFSFQCEPVKAIFQVDSLVFCYLCKRLAQHLELFIQNVQNNKILLQNYHNDLSSIHAVRSQVQPWVVLTPASLPSIQLSGGGLEESSSVIVSQELKIKLELKEEGLDHLELKEEGLDHLEGEFLDGSDDFPDPYVKEEDYPFDSPLKEEVETDSIDLKTLRKTIKRKVKRNEGKNGKISKSTNSNLKILSEQPNYIKIKISDKQCKKDRDERKLDQAYLDSIYKCDDCVKGFLAKETFDRHMMKHALNRGSFVCAICKQRFESTQKLYGHRKSHFIRYKCPDCAVLRVHHGAIKSHYADKHNSFGHVYKCTNCPKTFNHKISLRKHERYHSISKEKVTCAICEKSYVSKTTLLSHILRKHPSDGGVDRHRRRHMCGECGMAFESPSHLRNHANVHSDRRPYYCVECDRSFKTAAVLKQHLKTTTTHITYSELPLSCRHCDKRFAITRDLDRHMNRVHLNIKPFNCDKCDRAYVNSWSLREHKRYSHDGAKRPLRYPCAICDKVFDRSSILKAHVRTHTGERPYHCTQCPAQFSQGSALGTHVKLVHLKLTRDGRPKQSSMK